MRDEDIDLSDIPEITEEMFAKAVLRIDGKVVPKEMVIIHMPFDPEVLDYFQAKAGDRAYWELINAVLRERMHEELQAENDAQRMPEPVA